MTCTADYFRRMCIGEFANGVPKHRNPPPPPPVNAGRYDFSNPFHKERWPLSSTVSDCVPPCIAKPSPGHYIQYVTMTIKTYKGQ